MSTIPENRNNRKRALIALVILAIMGIIVLMATNRPVWPQLPPPNPNPGNTNGPRLDCPPREKLNQLEEIVQGYWRERNYPGSTPYGIQYFQERLDEFAYTDSIQGIPGVGQYAQIGNFVRMLSKECP